MSIQHIDLFELFAREPTQVRLGVVDGVLGEEVLGERVRERSPHVAMGTTILQVLTVHLARVLHDAVTPTHVLLADRADASRCGILFRGGRGGGSGLILLLMRRRHHCRYVELTESGVHS